MTNADKFKSIFGLYATELWAKPEKDFLEWLNADAEPFENSAQLDTISRQAAIDALGKDPMGGLNYERILGSLPSAQTEIVASGDCISRQAAIDSLSEWHDEAITNRLNNLPSAQQWIPCKKRLPYAEYGESDTVLTTCGYRDVEDTSVKWIRLLYFNGGNWCYPTGETYEAKVYAWMPLPELYKEPDNG